MPSRRSRLNPPEIDRAFLDPGFSRGLPMTGQHERHQALLLQQSVHVLVDALAERVARVDELYAHARHFHAARQLAVDDDTGGAHRRPGIRQEKLDLDRGVDRRWIVAADEDAAPAEVDGVLLDELSRGAEADLQLDR